MAKRVYLAKIVKSFDPQYDVGSTLIFNKPERYTKRGEIDTYSLSHFENRSFIDVKKCVVVGLGRAEFKDEEDYKARLGDVIEGRCIELGVSKMVIE